MDIDNEIRISVNKQIRRWSKYLRSQSERYPHSMLVYNVMESCATIDLFYDYLKRFVGEQECAGNYNTMDGSNRDNRIIMFSDKNHLTLFKLGLPKEFLNPRK